MQRESGGDMAQPTVSAILALARLGSPHHPGWDTGSVWLVAESDLRPATIERSMERGPWTVARVNLHPTADPESEGTASWLASLLAHGPDWVDVRVLDAAPDNLVLALVVSARTGPPRNGRTVLAGLLVSQQPLQRQLRVEG